MDKISNEEVMKFFKNKGYKIIGEYKNANTYVEAIQEKTGYKVRVSYTNLKINKSPIIFGYGNPFCFYNMKLYINKTFPNIKIISNKTIKKKNNKLELFTFKCSCGTIFNRLWYDIYKHDNLSCNECAIKRRGNAKRTGKNKIYQLCKKLNYKILECPNNPKNNDNILVEDINGYKAYTTYSHMRQGKGLGIFYINSNKNYFIDNVNNYCEINGIQTEAIEISKKQRHTTPTIIFKCGECGETFETSYSAFKTGKFRCSKCSNSMSLFEYKTKEFLDSLNIKYIKEYSFYDCKDILPLPFDFYLTDLNKIIEIDGQQHFVEKAFFHNREIADFTKTLLHDNIKNEYCKNNNISIIRIPYYDFNKEEIYKEKILQFIKE